MAEGFFNSADIDRQIDRLWLRVNQLLKDQEGDITEETDPIFSSSPANTITTQNITDWNNALQPTDAGFGLSYNTTTDRLELGEAVGQGHRVVIPDGELFYIGNFSTTVPFTYLNINKTTDPFRIQLVNNNNTDASSRMFLDPTGFVIETSTDTENYSVTKRISTNISTTGISIEDSIDSIGFVYTNDYSANGSSDPLWIPNIGHIQDTYAEQQSVTGQAPITANGIDMDVANQYLDITADTTLNIINIGDGKRTRVMITNSDVSSHNVTVNGFDYGFSPLFIGTSGPAIFDIYTINGQTMLTQVDDFNAT